MINTTGVRALIADMGRMPIELRRVLRPELVKAGALVAADARTRASWSTRIPGAIKVGAAFNSKTGGVSVRVSAKKAPHARPYEGIDGNATFRHPVYGTDTWVTEDTRPFLKPAVLAKSELVAAQITLAIKALHEGI